MTGPIASSIMMAMMSAGVSVAAQDVVAAPSRGNAQKVVLVELFTSEGCSSCPPADALLRQVHGMKTPAGQLIVGISEHVTYWNALGWADPFSSPTYTGRQNAYSTSFGLDSVYTPQMVVNGREQFVGSDKGLLEQAIRKERDQPEPVAVRILEAGTNGNSLTVRFSASGDKSLAGADIMAVLADDADQSSVLRGENSGRNLAHVSVARSIARVAKLQGTGEQTIQLPIPASFHNGGGHHLIVFAQARGTGRVLGADTVAVPDTASVSHQTH